MSPIFLPGQLAARLVPIDLRRALKSQLEETFFTYIAPGFIRSDGSETNL